MSIVCINLNIQHVNGMTYFEYLLSFDFSLFLVFLSLTMSVYKSS